MKMRIVGWNSKRGNKEEEVFVQSYIKGEWHQTVIEKPVFVAMMQISFPLYWKEFEESGQENPCLFFYHYGEDGKDTYIFES